MHTASTGSIASLVPFGLPSHLIVPLCIGLDVVAAIGLVVWIVLAVLRSRALRRALASRHVYDLLPSTSFDPGNEDVRRFARLLGSLRSTGKGLLPRKAAGVRIRLHTNAAGKVLYSLEGPHVVGNMALQAYPGIELRAVTAADMQETAPAEAELVDVAEDGEAA
jgi:hypothetical protein